jgi:hypothetical protein
MSTQSDSGGPSSHGQYDRHLSFIETLRRIERRIHRRICRHNWRPSRSQFGYMICNHCGKLSAD